ncbi:MAG TPA: hypothetical protein PKN61_05170 [Acidobacteriota bacterium]|jgi:hypothetical protein|nr:hypothetical protein [Acidobacteriota bacterium]HNR38406.1 hypothetical protein [Acidobacteriota bacterium]HNU01682.1 hypothetical protein [Acidobacteriota bacterium]HPB26635.1 hypothetical protein [Acidobacteriota bacterium]HQO24094.1 hypothetical protein [Acidobacteriota bacterium]
MHLRHLIGWALAVALAVAVPAEEKQSFPAPAPQACTAWLESQGVTIGAIPFAGEKRIRELFDSKELVQLGIVPVLVAAHNGADHPVVIAAAGFAVVDRQGQMIRALPWESVAMALLQPDGQVGAPPSTGIPPVDIIRMAGKGKKAKLIQAMKNHSFGTPTIAPGETAHGVVFFKLGTGLGIFDGANLYISEIFNADTREEMIYFEFPLKLPPEPPQK